MNEYDVVVTRAAVPSVVEALTNRSLNHIIPSSYSDAFARCVAGDIIDAEVFDGPRRQRVPARFRIVSVVSTTAHAIGGTVLNWLYGHHGAGAIPADKNAAWGGAAEEIHIDGHYLEPIGEADIPCGACGVFRGTMLKAGERSCFRCGWLRA